jgi:hypothetical protein
VLSSEQRMNGDHGLCPDCGSSIGRRGRVECPLPGRGRRWSHPERVMTIDRLVADDSADMLPAAR